MSDIRMLSVGTELPGPALDNAALARRLGMGPQWEQWVDSFVATRARHLAVDIDTGEVRQSLADIGEAAARKALSAAGVDPAAVDLVVMGTATPDTLMPATVNVIADRLRIDGVPTFQLQSGCSGAVQALEVARTMLLAGQHRTALVLGGDVCAKHAAFDLDLARLPPAQLVNLVLFGDGAGAAVLSTEGAPGSAAVRHVFTRLTGLDRAPGQVVDWYGLADRDSDRPAGSEDYKAIEESVPVMAAEILAELLKETGWEHVDYLLPPQLSGRMTARIMEQLDAPGAEEISCVAETGNNGNALVFFQLERALARMAPGTRAVGIAVESSKWIKAGFALEKA